MCTIESDVDIGEYLCLEWRTGGDDGWDIVQVSYKVLVRCDKILNHILNSIFLILIQIKCQLLYLKARLISVISLTLDDGEGERTSCSCRGATKRRV